MPVDFQIRPVGRPQVSEDSSLGYRKLVRRYVVEGPRVSKEGIESSPKLFREVGEVDEEFEDYFLVTQQVEPTTTVDKAHLSRTYVQFRNSWFGESVSENRDMKRLSRRYMVLKQSESNLPPAATGLGYDDTTWQRHPSAELYSPDGDITEPWDMLPSIITKSEPGAMKDGVLTSALAHPYSYPMFELQSTLLDAGYTEGSSNSPWVRGSAQVDTSNPGFDVWNVAWVAPSIGYWSSGSAAGGGGSPPLIVDFGENGLKVTPAESASGVRAVTSFTFFHVGTQIPIALAGSRGSDTPYVTVDVRMADKNKAGLGATHTFKNAVFTLGSNTTATLDFQGIEVASKKSFGYGSGSLVFDYDAGPKDGASTGTPAGWSATLPKYQNREIIAAGGHISWTHLWLSSSSGSNLVKTTVTPIHSHRGKHIWRITFTYA